MATVVDGSGLELLTRSDSYLNAPVGSADGLALAVSTVAKSVVFDLAGSLPSATVTDLPWLGMATQEFLQLFDDGFESGDTSAWDATVGN